MSCIAPAAPELIRMYHQAFPGDQLESATNDDLSHSLPCYSYGGGDCVARVVWLRSLRSPPTYNFPLSRPVPSDFGMDTRVMRIILGLNHGSGLIWKHPEDM